jgi:hypothetical protein
MDAHEHFRARRLAATRTYGCRTMDAMNPHWACPRCERPVRDPNVYTVGSIGYWDFSELEQHSKQVLGVMEHREALHCTPCGVAAVLRAGDYHAFHSERGVDIVIRWTSREAPPTRLWWNGAEYVPLTTLTDDEDLWFWGDATIRKATTRLEVEGVAAAVEDIILALEQLPGEPQMLAFVDPLLEAGYVNAARMILEEYTSRYPEDDAARMRLEALEPDE